MTDPDQPVPPGPDGVPDGVPGVPPALDDVPVPGGTLRVARWGDPADSTTQDKERNDEASA